jgi:hypothetical protein
VVIRDGLDFIEKRRNSCLCRETNTDSLARSPSLCGLKYPYSQLVRNSYKYALMPNAERPLHSQSGGAIESSLKKVEAVWK